MMIRYFCILLLSAFISMPAFAIDGKALLEAGNKAYESGDFAEAILDYEKILAADMSSAAVHYNLGCAYFNQEIYGRAILHFEKARQISPRDADILHNLEYTKLFLKDRFDLPEPMPIVAWVGNLSQSLSLTELKQLEMMLFGIFLISIMAFRLFRTGRFHRSLVVIVTLSGVLFLAASGWLIDRAVALDHKRGVLLVDQINVSSAPLDGSSTLFVIHEGTSGEILDTTDSWYKIRLPDGKTGWILHEVVGLY